MSNKFFRNIFLNLWGFINDIVLQYQAKFGMVNSRYLQKISTHRFTTQFASIEFLNENDNMQELRKISQATNVWNTLKRQLLYNQLTELSK